MLKFSLEKHTVVVDPISITLQPLLAIYLADLDPLKAEGTRILTYIHLCSQIDPNAPYSRVDPSDVNKLVKKEIWRDFDYKIDMNGIDDAAVEDAIMHYQMAYESSEESAMRAYDKKIHEIRTIIDTTKIEIKTSVNRGTVSYVSNFTIINKMMQDIIKIVKARDELKAHILRQTSRDSIKGQKKLSFADKRRRTLNNTKISEEDKDPSEDL